MPLVARVRIRTPDGPVDLTIDVLPPRITLPYNVVAPGQLHRHVETTYALTNEVEDGAHVYALESTCDCERNPDGSRRPSTGCPVHHPLD